jgi:predicted short-subunit dehydrogenase-like oxidoreductase (DUF2520 family)
MMATLRTLNIVGCGKVGMTLGRLWTAAGTFSIQDVLNRSPESGKKAVAFMGAGIAVESLAAMRAADVWMITVPDDSIAACCNELAQARLFSRDCIVFHCSGALTSGELNAASACGAAIASMHPIRSFAAAEQAAATFGGTWCGVEGDLAAVGVLDAAIAAIGGIPVAIDAGYKTVYHAAAVFASNYLVTLLDVAVQAYEKAGIPQEAALRLMEPLVRGTVDNVFRLGTTEALTGPIARGDIATAVRQYKAVSAWDERHGALYKQLGKMTADIAARRRGKC